MKTAISVDNLSKIYKLYPTPVDRLKESINPLGKKYHTDFYALKNISLDIFKGEAVGIVGKNGSGKSTLLKILTGVLNPTSGKVSVAGRVSSILELGAGFNPDLSGIDNIYFNGAIMGFTREEMDQKLDAVLDFAEIGQFAYQEVKKYSSGMFIRLAFATAIIVEPEILVVDEALAVGDIRFQRKCYSVIESLHQKNVTILFVSHALDTVNMLCTRAILLDNGEVVADGVPKEVTKLFYKMMMEHDEGQKDEEILSDQTPSSLSANNNGFDDVNFVASDNVCKAKKAEIIGYKIRDRLGKDTTILESGLSYILEAEVLVHEPLQSLYVGFPIKNTKGVLLFAVNTALQNLKLRPQEPGDVVLCTAEVTIYFARGDYFVSVRAGNFGEDFDEVEDAIHIVVTGGSDLVPGSIVDLQPTLHICNLKNSDSNKTTNKKQ